MMLGKQEWITLQKQSSLMLIRVKDLSILYAVTGSILEIDIRTP